MSRASSLGTCAGLRLDAPVDPRPAVVRRKSMVSTTCPSSYYREREVSADRRKPKFITGLPLYFFIVVKVIRK